VGKHILFLNATYIHKIATLATAKDLGFTVTVVDTALPDWASPYTDCFIEADTYDLSKFEEALVALRKRHEELPFDGVVTFWHYGILPAALVAAEFGLPGCSVEAAENACNKFKMREALRRADVPHPKFALATNWDDLLAASAMIGYPLIYKVAGAAGSAGVFKVTTPGELRAIYEQSQNHVNPENDLLFAYYPQQYVVEEFMEGREVSVEAIVAQGIVHSVAVTDKWATPTYFTEYQHAIPARLDQTTSAEVIRVTEAGVKALGLDNCGVHAEVMITQEGCKIVEINARLGGDFITTHLVPLACGVDIVRANLLAVVGEPFDLTQRWQRGSCVRFLLAEREGFVNAWKGVESLQHMTGVRTFGIDKQVGDVVFLPPKKFFGFRIGYVITDGNDVAEAIQRAERAATELQCIIL